MVGVGRYKEARLIAVVLWSVGRPWRYAPIAVFRDNAWQRKPPEVFFDHGRGTLLRRTVECKLTE